VFPGRITSPGGPASNGDADPAPAKPENPGAAERHLAALPLPALVFCRSRKRVEGIARELAATPAETTWAPATPGCEWQAFFPIVGMRT